MQYKYPWQSVKEYKEIVFHTFEGIARISINRPHVHNAFTPLTVSEMIDAMNICRENPDVRVIVLTGEGGKAFCSGGDQSVRGHGGYVGEDTTPRLNVLDLQRIIRSIPKPVIAAVAGWAIGGGHVLTRCMRSYHCSRKCPVWADRTKGRQLRRRFWRLLPGTHCRSEKSTGDMVPMRPI